MISWDIDVSFDYEIPALDYEIPTLDYEIPTFCTKFVENPQVDGDTRDVMNGSGDAAHDLRN